MSDIVCGGREGEQHQRPLLHDKIIQRVRLQVQSVTLYARVKQACRCSVPCCPWGQPALCPPPAPPAPASGCLARTSASGARSWPRPRGRAGARGSCQQRRGGSSGLMGKRHACMSHVARHTSHVARHTSHITRRTSHVTRRTSHVTHHALHVTHHTSHVTRHTSHVTRHTSHVTHHASNVTRQT